MSQGAKKFSACGCLISTIIAAIVIGLAFWILRPKCTIEDFDIFTLHGSNQSTVIHYDIMLKNRNFNKGIYYDTLNLTFYYKPNSHDNSFLIGNDTISPFYQGYRKSTHRVGGVEAKGVKSENAALPNGKAVFRVELATEVRYKSPLWKSKRHSLALGADLKVDSRGSLIKGKDKGKEYGIVLVSAAGRSMGCFKVGGILGILIFIHFL
ncbi:hypothetical protein RND81_12G202900 [Saponaria officinalis]|uniref:Late embryogenesis abundant protein LEA-2 subgroup domain-containing protein n=1 Tax=Saponaria officinalis TaxID=3572 RepID=A0AAW1HD65_SAPOF